MSQEIPNIQWTLTPAQAQRLSSILMKVNLPAEQTLDLILGLQEAILSGEGGQEPPEQDGIRRVS